MIINAVTELPERKGTSINQIRKYLAENYDISQTRMNQASKLLKSVDEEGSEGWLIRTSGKGIRNDSHFKLPGEKKRPKKQKEDVEPAKVAPKRKMQSAKEEVPEKKKKAIKEKVKVPAADKKKKDVKKKAAA